MKNQNLINALNECVAACNHCASACLAEEGVKMMARCIQTDIVCAEICSTTAKVIAFDSSLSQEMVDLCRKICSECAAECEKHDMEHCRHCAEVCRRCEKACSAYAA